MAGALLPALRIGLDLAYAILCIWMRIYLLTEKVRSLMGWQQEIQILPRRKFRQNSLDDAVRLMRKAAFHPIFLVFSTFQRTVRNYTTGLAVELRYTLSTVSYKRSA